MKKMKGKGLKHILTMAFTFAMVMVFAGLTGKVDAYAEDYICKATVLVKDSETGEIIENAQVIFTEYYKPNNPIETVTRNEDGTYNLPYDEWGMYYKYYATADGYKSSALKSAGCIETATVTLPDIVLEKYPPVEQLQNEITKTENEIKNYLNEDDYDAEQIAEINKIIDKYLERIESEVEVGDETADSVNEKKVLLANIISDAKAELDQVVTAQSKRNDEYADYISFVSADGTTTKVLAGSNGKYSITMSMQDAGGKFQVKGCEDGSGVTWNAKDRVWSGNQMMTLDREYIAQNVNKGVFLNAGSTPPDAPFVANTLKDCSVTFTPSGSEVPVTVVFDLIVKDKMIKDLTIDSPSEAVVLSRNDDLDYTTVLKFGSDYSVTVNYDNEDSKDLDADEVTIESITPAIATVDENRKIKALAAGVAEFRATVKDETGSYDKEFSIEFVKSEKEEKEIADAAEVTSKIEALGTITLEKETAVSEARDAYDDLSSNAKKRISKETLSTLKAAEKEIASLKAKKAADDKAAAEKAAADKAVADKVAADKATADKAAADKATADKAAAEAVEKKIAALGTITLTKESAVKAARDAYDALDSSAKKLVKAASLTTLKAAEQKIYDLKVDKAAADKVAAEKAAAAKKAAADKKKYTPTAPKWKSLKSTKKGAATLTWAKNSKATGYEIYVSTKKTSGFKKLATVKSWKKVTYTKTKLKSKTTYYFKIRAYKTVNKTTYRSAYSTVKKVKTK